MQHSTNCDPYGLNRFQLAQADVYRDVLSELRAGNKVGHWMWFVFPQVAGLGVSAMSELYAIASLDEAAAYLQHPVLGRRLTECTEVLLRHNGKTAYDIFGATDARKLRSSMTLFARVAPNNEMFREVLARYFEGIADDSTDRIIQGLNPVLGPE